MGGVDALCKCCHKRFWCTDMVLLCPDCRLHPVGKHTIMKGVWKYGVFQVLN